MRSRLLWILLWLSAAAWAQHFSADAKRNCQQMDVENGTVTLIFATDSAHFNVCPDSILGVWVSGSINDLGDADEGYELDQWSDDGCLYHTFRCDELLKPGNSGQPEFVFYLLRTDSTDANYYAYDQQEARIDDWLLCYNGIPYTLIMMPCGPDYFTTDSAELRRRCEEAREIRPLSDYNLADPAEQHWISNFRHVPGTKQLYRSYHPYFPSNPKYDTEQQRLYWVAELGRQAGIRSDISLTGNLEGREGQWYMCGGDSFEIVIPDYQRALMDSGNVLYVGQMLGRNPSVVDCYYHSDEEFFAQYMREVVLFVADTAHPMPVQIHCAIGADRTGMVCALLAALCGAEWEAIVADYEATGQMKIQTYRHANRLRYAIERMTGLNPDCCTSAQLAAAIRHHLVVEMNVLTDADIDAAVARLCADTNTHLVECAAPVSGRWDILGRPVGTRYHGVVIDGTTKKWNLGR